MVKDLKLFSKAIIKYIIGLGIFLKNMHRLILKLGVFFEASTKTQTGYLLKQFNLDWRRKWNYLR